MIACIEGVDLCGKGTQVKMMMERVPGPSKVIKFPNRDSDTGRMIYEHLDRRWAVEFSLGLATTREEIEQARERVAPARKLLDATVFQALQTVNRLELAEEINRYRGTHNEWLILDRYWPSGVVFGGADGLDTDWLLAIHSSLPQPDYFVLIDVDLADVVKRAKHMASTGERKLDRYEGDDKVGDRIARYRRLWDMLPGELAPWKTGTWRVVNGRHDPELVYQDVLRALLPKRVV